MRRGGGRRSLAGRRVLVTGGSSGIGLAVARELDARAVRLVLLARGAEALAGAGAQLTGCAGVLSADVSHADEVTAAIAEAGTILGGLDAVVACAGVGAYGPFAEMEPDDWSRIVEITLIGVMNTAHAAVPALRGQRGTLVVVGSVAGRLPVPWLAAYTAAKHGVRGFLRSLDGELRAQRVPVSLALISPGPVDTPFWRRARTPDGRLPPEIRGAYPAQDVAAEVVRAIAAPGRLERAVGGALLPAILLDALVPNLLQLPLGLLARLGWHRRTERPHSDDDALAQPARAPSPEGGLTTRRSGLQRLRALVTPRA